MYTYTSLEGAALCVRRIVQCAVAAFVVLGVWGAWGVVCAASSDAKGVLLAPAVTPAVAAGDVVGFVLENNSSERAEAQVLSFGEVFVVGDVPQGSDVFAVLADGARMATQMDVKTRYSDGSVATAVISIVTPLLMPDAAMQVMLRRADGLSQGAALDPRGFVGLGYDTRIDITQRTVDGGVFMQTIDAGAALDAALVRGDALPWLSGPLVSEVRVVVALSDALRVKLNIRGTVEGTFLTDVQVAHDGIFGLMSVESVYGVRVSSHGELLWEWDEIRQVPMQAWRYLAYSDAEGGVSAPVGFVVYDVPYMGETGFVPVYDVTLGVAAEVVERQMRRLTPEVTGPMGSALVTRYQPTTGGREDIGLMTAWAANWLVSQDEDAFTVMLANATAAAAAPFHAVNPDGSLVSVVRNPTLWLDSRATGDDQSVVNVGMSMRQSAWTLDTAHMPDLSYIAALTQGSQFYVDQLQAQAHYNVLSVNPEYRGGALGVVVDAAQVRGLAWTLRDLANAALLTPDTDEYKAEFVALLDNNIQRILTEYVHGPVGAQQGELSGYVIGVGSGGTVAQVAPWQQGYLAVVMASIAQRGFAGASEICAWQNAFIMGLFLNAERGYNPLHGPAYWLTVGTIHKGGSYTLAVTTWEGLYKENFPGAAPTVLAGYPDDAVGGYPAILKAALAMLWEVTREADTRTAYAYLAERTPRLGSAENRYGYRYAQTWNIPLASDGVPEVVSVPI